MAASFWARGAPRRDAAARAQAAASSRAPAGILPCEAAALNMPTIRAARTGMARAFNTVNDP